MVGAFVCFLVIGLLVILLMVGISWFRVRLFCGIGVVDLGVWRWLKWWVLPVHDGLRFVCLHGFWV